MGLVHVQLANEKFAVTQNIRLAPSSRVTNFGACNNPIHSPHIAFYMNSGHDSDNDNSPVLLCIFGLKSQIFLSDFILGRRFEVIGHAISVFVSVRLLDKKIDSKIYAKEESS